MSNPAPSAASILYPRIAKWIPHCPMEVAGCACMRLCTLGSQLPGFVATACLKSLFNSWITTR
eukprot:2047491-Pyramimonas_sp.AAC.1